MALVESLRKVAALLRATVVAVLITLTVLGCGGRDEDAETRETMTGDALPWLEGYDGQTVEELLRLASSHRPDSVVLAIEEALMRKPSRSLTTPERVVLAVEALEREVNNGGYNQFFLNAPKWTWLIVDALAAIDCPETASITSEAVAVLNVPEGSRVEQISERASAMSDADDVRLSELDARFYEYPDPIVERLLDYVERHRADITLP